MKKSPPNDGLLPECDILDDLVLNSDEGLELTSENRTRTPALAFGISMLVWAMLLALFLHFSSSASDWVGVMSLFTSWLPLGFGFWISRNRTICRTCGARVRWESKRIPRHAIEATVTKYRLKTPLSYKRMLRSQNDWKLVGQTCECCRYMKVVSMSP